LVKKPFGFLPTTTDHLGHDNIRKYCNRPFDNVWKMDEVIIKNHNAVVKPQDIFYHLGDFAWNNKGKAIEYLRQLNGKKFFLAGNHDKVLFKRDTDFNIVIRSEVVPYVEWIKDYHELTIQDKTAPRKKRMIVMSHYAPRVWNKSHYQSYSLWGHSHGSLLDGTNALSIDVGIDATAKRYSANGVLNPEDYRPLCYEEIQTIMESKNYLSVDHHK